MENILEKTNNKIIQKYFLKVRWDQNKKIILFFGLGLLLIMAANFFENSDKNLTKKFHLDATIPEGYVLVPVPIVNADSISSMIGRYGVVDLFLSQNGLKSKKIISKVKIVQASDDLNSFAVLLKEDQSQKILNYNGPFFAVIQNPTRKSQETFQSGKQTIVINYQK